MPAQELHQPVIKKLKGRKSNARFKGDIWVADLAEIVLLSSKNWGVKYLCVIDVFTKYVWVKPLMDKKAKAVLNGFTGILNESKCKQWSNGQVVKALDFQSRGPVFKTTGWLQGRLSLSSFRGR